MREQADRPASGREGFFRTARIETDRRPQTLRMCRRLGSAVGVRTGWGGSGTTVVGVEGLRAAASVIHPLGDACHPPATTVVESCGWFVAIPGPDRGSSSNQWRSLRSIPNVSRIDDFRSAIIAKGAIRE